MNQVTQNGDLYTWTIPVANSGSSNGTQTVVTDVLPLGVKYLSSYTIPANVGTILFNAGTNTVTWDIGLLPKGTEYVLKINTKILDITENPFTNTATITGSLVDPDPLNNTFTEVVTVTTCAPSAGAITDPLACVCGNVSTNDAQCTHGLTEYRINPLSLVNLDPSFTVDPLTGSFNANGKILNLFDAASFQYSIWCTPQGESPLETSGPVVVTIPAFFNSGQTINPTLVKEFKIVIPPGAFVQPEVPTDAEVVTWITNISNVPIVQRNGSAIVYNRPSTGAGNGMTYEYVWWTFDLTPGISIVRIKNFVPEYYTELPVNLTLTRGAVGQTFNLATAYTSTCPGTTTYQVYTNPWITVVSVVGSTLTYNVNALIPSGENNIVIIPTCNV